MTMHDLEWLCRPLLPPIAAGNGVDLLIDGEWAERIARATMSSFKIMLAPGEVAWLAC